ncbi:putative membrane protein [Kaistia hirudinis]|uniref:Putative membrane protein n=1 Tax=Kaistia hirudinis TaxID=1293440 RepID=A0A840AY39_9HYPH|nr:DUF202 domain-containing protein [Kaistia hirudinis]MBB3933711.1 putative membrane protein [Kaistia hirudinis]
MTELPEPNPRFDASPSVSNHFAWLRSVLALERTMMAWLRTAASLISFGFAIVQFFARFGHMPGVHEAHIPRAPEYLGLALIGCGVLALLASLWRYHWTRRYLSQGPFAPIAGTRTDELRSPVVWLAILLAGVGVFAFVSVLLDLVPAGH